MYERKKRGSEMTKRWRKKSLGQPLTRARRTGRGGGVPVGEGKPKDKSARSLVSKLPGKSPQRTKWPVRDQGRPSFDSPHLCTNAVSARVGSRLKQIRRGREAVSVCAERINIG